MASTGTDVAEALRNIADRTSDDMSEKDVENAFLNEQFYSLLGYEGAGHDLRSEMTLPDNRRPDYITLDSNDAVTVVYEFKAPGEKLGKHTEQLFHYAEVLKADYGVLTDGESFRWFRRGDRHQMADIRLPEVTVSQAHDLYSALRKPEWDIRNPEHVHTYIEELRRDGVGLDSDLGQEHFFDTFRLEEGSPFAELVTGLMDLLTELRDEKDNQFVTSAYNFWTATYASEPDETPESWEPFIDGDHSLNDFMYCLESAHALLARLLLAKATEDHDFFEGTAYGGMDDYFWGLQGFGTQINLEAYPVGAVDLIRDMRDQLVKGLFQDDIFIWWTEAYKEQLERGHASGANRFTAIAKEEQRIKRISEATQERFSRSVAHIFFNVLRFDFSAAEGDLLGDLYQRYFDPETRKALGEFYTPQPVIEYIMDGVDYNRGVSNQRLIDPACGSGTFLVEAVNRYIADVEYYEDDPDWERHLRDLCSKPRIVGLDIHPFAVLMAQIRFVVAILPAYREAKQGNPSFTLSRIPIYRTDTLRNERELTGVDIGDADTVQLSFDALTEDARDVLIPTPLPIEVEDDVEVETEDGFLVRRIRMPKYDSIRLETGIGSFDEYFAALQGVIDTVKEHLRIEEETDLSTGWEYQQGLEESIHRYTSQEYPNIESFFSPYVDDMLEHVRYLKEEHDDGRLFKMLEDSVLALVVKNYMEYDYVVGNPPYVRIQNLPDAQKAMMDTLYESTTGNYDIYCPFFERGLQWLTRDSGKLGYIAPNQFMVTDYGEGLRRVLLDNARIEEVYDFRDSGVFADAKNYPAIVILEDEPDPEGRASNKIRCVRVKGDTQPPSNRDLDTVILESVQEHRDEPGYEDEYINVFDYPQGDLDYGYWSLMPPEELKIIHKMEAASDATVGDVTDSVFAGTQTSANDIFIVRPVDADRIAADDAGDTVTVIPKGEDREYEIETDTLRPWLQGRDINRWRGDWSGEHAIVPYTLEYDESGNLTSNLINQQYLETELPLTWKYFEEHRETLEGREGGRFEDRDDWYGFGYPKSMTRFEDPKLICPEIAAEATFMLDDIGTWYFKAAYGIQLETEFKERTDTFAALLNSNALDFYLKHYTALKVDGFYKYTTNYLTPLPIAWGDEEDRTNIRSIVSSITGALDTESKIRRFPEAYIGEYEGELEYITYEWQTRRYPVSAEIHENDDSEFSVRAGRSDVITDPAMYASERDVRKRRAEYVQAAVSGRNVRSGETTTIPIPRNDKGVEKLMDSLNSNQKLVDETDLSIAEEQVNKIIYDIYDITSDEQTVIEEYLETFRVY